MTSQPLMDDQTRAKIIRDPDALLDDKDIMKALVAANERSLGGNIVDLRGIAMERLETRLDRLEDTHRTVIAAAYENLAGTNQIHRAILKLMDALEFETFLKSLSGEISDILRVDSIRLVLEGEDSSEDKALQRLGDVLFVAPEGYIEDYITHGRNIPIRPVTLRQCQFADPHLFGDTADYIRSEAVLKLDFGEGRTAGMLVMGAEDPHLFTPQQGTDLLAFFGGVFERAMRRWLS